MTHFATISVINDHLCGISSSQIRQMLINIRFSEKIFPEHLEIGGVTLQKRGGSTKRGTQAKQGTGGRVLVFGFGLYGVVMIEGRGVMQSSMVLGFLCGGGKVVSGLVMHLSPRVMGYTMYVLAYLYGAICGVL